MNHKFHLPKSKNAMRGATILEVIVSVFLLTFGILALIAAQIRSVAGIQEAENRTLVAQAAEAYAEGMLANPTVTIKDDKSVVITYDDYYTGGKTGQNFLDVDTTKTTIQKLTTNASQSKKQLAELHTNNFQAALNTIPDVAGIQFTVCQDEEANGTAKSPTWGNGNCNKGVNAGTVIKVAWRMKDKEGKTNTDDALHTYVLKVRS